MRVFLTGGTGFVGREVLRQLTEAGHTVRALVRPGSEGKLAIRQGVEVHRGDVTEPASLQGALQGCAAVVHLVGIIRESPGKGVTFRRMHTEATVHMVRAAEAQGVRRFLHMSANGVRERGGTEYHRTKWDAEQAVRWSSLEWTIFRPSLIFGPEDEFVTMLADLIRKLPIVPVVGNGRYRMSPVAVEDVAAAFCRALERPETVRQIYPCCGPRSFTYDEILDHVGQALGKGKVRKIHQPAALVAPIISLLDAFPRFLITREQLTMLLEGNTCDPVPWGEAFGIVPRTFPEGIRRYLK